MSRLVASLLLALGVFGCAPTEEPARHLVAASNMLHPPFSSWSDDGRAVGSEVEIVEAAARELGATVEWVEKPFGELLELIEAGTIDVAVSTIGITDERSKRVGFSESYYQTEIVALVLRDDAAAARTLDDLANGTIGADEGTTSYPAARRRWPDATLVGKVDEGSTWPAMVAAEALDAFVVDASDQQRLEKLSGVLLRRIDEPLSAEYFGVAMALDDDELRAAVNRAIAARSAN